MWIWRAPLLLIAGIGAWLLARRPLRAFGREVQSERAREHFSLQREMLEARFVDAAARTGKPRGLRWKDCDFGDDYEIARDNVSGQFLALVPVTIQFEAIEGSDMEGLSAVGNLRNATAVFFFQRGQWHTHGKAIFNLNPLEVIQHFHKQYEHVPVHS